MTTKPARYARLAILSFTLLAVGAAWPAAAQDVRLLSTKVADILARFPADSPAGRDALADEILGLGAPGLAEFAKRLVPAGAGDDTAVRFAVNAAAVRASQRPEPTRALAENALADALAAATDVEVRTFLLSQLRLVGRDRAVKAAAPLLADAQMVEPATQLLLAVKSPAARSALLSALDGARGPARVTVIKALGELGAADAAPKVAALAGDEDLVVRKTALAALAHMANPSSYDVLVAAADKAGYQYEPANAVGALLDYARRVGAKSPATAERACRLLMQKADDPSRLPVRAAALGVLADVRGAAALPDLLQAVDHDDIAYRNAALLKAEKIRADNAVDRWVAKAGKVDAVRRAEIVAMLGRQGDARAVPFLRSSLGAPDADVSLAAATALAHVQGAKAVPDLLGLLKTATAETGPRVAEVLGWTIDEKGLDPVAAMLDTLQPAGKAAAVTVIGAKNGKRFAARVMPLTADASPEIRAAAVKALAGVVGPDHLPDLLKMLDGSPSAPAAGAPAAEAAYVADVQRAVVAAAGQVTPGDARAKPILDALKTAAHPERFVAVLSEVGGPQALATLVDLFEGSNFVLKAAAFRAMAQWRGPEAAGRLFDIYAAAGFRDQAFAGFLRQVSSSSLPDEQKVLQFRKALSLNPPLRERRQLLRALERAKTFQSFLVAASYLDDAELGSDAAGAVMRIALPSPGARDGLSGRVVREALEKVLQRLEGPEAEYEKENVRTYLRTMPQDEGFVPLFNGKDLSGWQGLVENPLVRAKLSPEELAKRQLEADAKARTNWSVRDGAIVFNGKGANLCTVKAYGDFEMLVDWRITRDGDSGIYLRGTPQVQIWDPARTDVGAQVGSGGLYNNQKNPSKPLVFADNPVGEWNTFRIRMVGDKVTVFLNGVKVVDDVTMENYWDRSQPIFARGPIELQAHGTDLAFRDLYVRDLGGAAPAQALAPEEQAQGFVPLFNGRNLDGWIGNQTGYKVEGGAIVFDPKAGDRSNLYTAREYSDFQFRFEFQLTPGANSGVGIRTPNKGDAAYVGMEIQVLDDTAPVYANLQPYQYHGSVYGIIPAKRGSLEPVGEWNSEEIFVQGSRIKVTVNGQVVVDGDLVEATRNGPMDHKDHPGLQRSSGYIGFLSHDTVVRFRNIRIKDLGGK